MEENKIKWNLLMDINEKMSTAINFCKLNNDKLLNIPLTLDELNLIAKMSNSEINTIKES